MTGAKPVTCFTEPMEASVQTRPGWKQRILSSLVDYLVIAAWLLVLTGFSFVIAPFLPPLTGRQDLLATDVIVLGATVFPVWLYLSLTEASEAAGTLGKRVQHLAVQAADGGRAPWRRIALRNVVKLLPWQLAHLGVSRFMLDQQFGVAIACYVASWLLLIATIVMAARDPQRRALHDRLAGTRVITTAQSNRLVTRPPSTSV